MTVNWGPAIKTAQRNRSANSVAKRNDLRKGTRILQDGILLIFEYLNNQMIFEYTAGLKLRMSFWVRSPAVFFPGQPFLAYRRNFLLAWAANRL